MKSSRKREWFKKKSVKSLARETNSQLSFLTQELLKPIWTTENLMFSNEYNLLE
jgi:hypothetical protein